VQVHPTGLVEPSDPDAKVKWLAAEALRGCGGIILDCEGNRFCDELGKRDYVTGRMWAHGKPPYRLILNTAARKQINWHCEHYAARGLMKKLTGAQLADEIGCPKATLDATFGDYNRYSATPGTDPWGKKYFNAVPFSCVTLIFVCAVFTSLRPPV
jgi:FAD binding domain